MIYCNLKGGFANMMFQIAATKSMAIDKGVDCSFPNLHHQYRLINDDVIHNPKLKHSDEYNHIFYNLNIYQPKNHIPMVHFPFEYHNIPVPDGDCYVDGFFQTEKYFRHNKEQIIEFLKPSQEVQDIIDSKYGELLNQRTSSIHVRRGDYSRFPNHHPVQTIEYYTKAIELLTEKTDKFIVFSDDIEWCKENFNFINPIYIENEKDYIEIYLMSMCNNNIIANSSFSLWAACINQNKDKIVIGPEKWFGPEITVNSVDTLNEEWIKL